MRRIGRQQRLDDRLFGCLVDFGHEVVALLAGDQHRFHVQAGPVDQAAGLSGGAYRDVEHWMHGWPDPGDPEIVEPWIRIMTLPSTLHQPLAPSAQGQLGAFRFVLVAPSHAGNIGSVVRAMRTMGLGDLVVVNPRDADFINHPQARALASGANGPAGDDPTAASLQEAVADCQLVVAVSASPREFGPLPETPCGGRCRTRSRSSGRARSQGGDGVRHRADRLARSPRWRCARS